MRGFEREFQHPIIEWLIKEAFQKVTTKQVDSDKALSHIIENVEKYNYMDSLREGFTLREKLASEEWEFQKAQVVLLESKK